MMAAQKELEERYASDAHCAKEAARNAGSDDSWRAQIEQLEVDVAERDQKLEEMMAAQKELEERYASDAMPPREASRNAGPDRAAGSRCGGA
ncbi:hypothetical protein TcBrA4_0053060 [Trypanosoma cruzi]|nr:hypothetical protein TcBrA4_0053060 [Trypanosoma cruzi]